MKQEFLNFINSLMEANPNLTKELMTENIQAYLDMLNELKEDTPEISEKGKILLKCLQDNPEVKLWKAKDIADVIGISSRGVSGSMRKLVTDGFCDKMGENPAIYCLTEKGKNYEIN